MAKFHLLRCKSVLVDTLSVSLRLAFQLPSVLGVLLVQLPGCTSKRHCQSQNHLRVAHNDMTAGDRDKFDR